MAVGLWWKIQDSHVFRNLPRLKMMLGTLGNFAGEDGTGKVFNQTLGRHAGIGDNQVRKYKNTLSEMGLVDFTYVRGKGRHTSFKIDLVRLEMFIDKAAKGDTIWLKDLPNYIENLPLSRGGVEGEVTPLQKIVTPPQTPQNPSPEGYPKEEHLSKKGASASARGINSSGLAAYWRETLTQAFGEPWLKSWLVGQQIIETNGQVEMLVKNAFGKASVERKLETLNAGSSVRVSVGALEMSARA